MQLFLNLLLLPILLVSTIRHTTFNCPYELKLEAMQCVPFKWHTDHAVRLFKESNTVESELEVHRTCRDLFQCVGKNGVCAEAMFRPTIMKCEMNLDNGRFRHCFDYIALIDYDHIGVFEKCLKSPDSRSNCPVVSQCTTHSLEDVCGEFIVKLLEIHSEKSQIQMRKCIWKEITDTLIPV